MMFMMMGNTLSIILSTSFVVLLGQNPSTKCSKPRDRLIPLQQHQDLVGVISKVEHSASQLTDFAPRKFST